MDANDVASNGALATARPRIGSQGTAAEEAERATRTMVAELQEGLDQRDADLYNRHFASDVLWGSPYGLTVFGYDELHAIHARLQAEGTGGEHSRYSVVRVLGIGENVALAHVRREPITDPQEAPSDGSLAEMAMYVLARSGNEWWLVAGQNTPIRPAATAGGER